MPLKTDVKAMALKKILFAFAILMVLAAAGAIVQARQEAPQNLRIAGSPFQAKGVQLPEDPDPDPDRALYELSLTDLKESRFTAARLKLQTLINTYPDSEYLESAKFTFAESFYKEGTPSSYTRAEAAFKDYLTSFPTSWEADVAQY